MLKPDAWTYRITAHNLFEGLVRIDPRTNDVEPELAERYEVTPDGKRYTFTLRQGVKWHDDVPMSARDVKFTFDRIFDPKVSAASTRATLAQFVDKVTVKDAKTVVITLKQRSFYFLQALAAVMILPSHRMSSGDLNRHPLLRKPIGTGPYRFASWKSGQRIRLRRFAGYWGKKPAQRSLRSASGGSSKPLGRMARSAASSTSSI